MRRAQGRPVNAYGVAVVSQTAEQRFHHWPAAQKVRPLIVDQIGGDDSRMLVVAPPLGTIRSLAYFLPVIEEVLRLRVSPDYFDHLRHKFARLATTRQAPQLRLRRR